MPHRPAKIISFLLCFLLIFEQSGFAQVAGQLDISSHILNLRNSLIQDKFRPLHLRYLSYDNVNNNFRLLLDKGDWLKGALPKEQDLEGATKTLLNYFFIGITLPNDSFWVNLRPDSPDNIIDSALAMTDVGKILLEADLQLKKDTAKFTSPETAEGKKYWGKLYQKAEEIFGTSNITIPTLTRPWIVPGEIIIREAEDNAYIYKATLKVCLEQDYLKDSATYNFKDERLKQLNEFSSQLIRELIIPKLTKEINCSKRYASLRQVYYSLILAQWFKQKFYGKGGLYASLIDRHNLTGLTSKTDWSKTTYFKEYQKSFKDGEYNIEEQVDRISGKTFRTYFSGGIAFANTIIPAITAGAVRGNPNRPISNASPKIIGVEVGGGTVVNPSSVELRKVEIKEEALGSQSDATLGGGSIGSGQIKDRAGQGQGKQEEIKLKKPSLFRRIITSIILTSVILNFFASRNLTFAATSRDFQERARIEKGEKAVPMINKMINSFSPGEWKEVLGMYKNKDFQDKTIKLSHANRFSLARAIVYTLRRFDAPANDENINKVLPFILKTRENYSSRVILDKSKNFIIASHKEFGFGYITELPKSFGIEKYEMFKPANSEDVAAVKQAFIKSVENSPFNTTILLEGHGGQNHFWLDGGEIGEHASYDLHKPEAISYKELAEALINRAKSHNGKLSDLTILVESCFSANFIVNTLNALAEEHNKGAIEDLPVVITAVNRNSTGYVGNFIADIQRAAQYGEYKGKLILSDVYKAEETADYLQDYAFFLPVSREELKELAQTLAEGKNEELSPYIQLEATRIDPSLPIIDGQIGKRAQLEEIDLQKNEIKVRDSAGAARVISLAAQAKLDVAAVKSQIEAMQDMKEGHKKIILEVLSLLEKSPPSLYTFTSLVEDFFGFASKKDNLIVIHQSFLDNPIAIFHEIGEYLVKSGALSLTLEGNSLNISVNGQQFSLVLQGETLAIAQKDPANPHYLLRALQRELFGEKDRLLTQEIKARQNNKPNHPERLKRTIAFMRLSLILRWQLHVSQAQINNIIYSVQRTINPGGAAISIIKLAQYLKSIGVDNWKTGKIALLLSQAPDPEGTIESFILFAKALQGKLNNDKEKALYIETILFSLASRKSKDEFPSVYTLNPKVREETRQLIERDAAISFGELIRLLKEIIPEGNYDTILSNLAIRPDCKEATESIVRFLKYLKEKDDLREKIKPFQMYLLYDFTESPNPEEALESFIKLANYLYDITGEPDIYVQAILQGFLKQPHNLANTAGLFINFVQTLKNVGITPTQSVNFLYRLEVSSKPNDITGAIELLIKLANALKESKAEVRFIWAFFHSLVETSDCRDRLAVLVNADTVSSLCKLFQAVGSMRVGGEIDSLDRDKIIFLLAKTAQFRETKEIAEALTLIIHKLREPGSYLQDKSVKNNIFYALFKTDNPRVSVTKLLNGNAEKWLTLLRFVNYLATLYTYFDGSYATRLIQMWMMLPEELQDKLLKLITAIRYTDDLQDKRVLESAFELMEYKIEPGSLLDFIGKVVNKNDKGAIHILSRLRDNDNYKFVSQYRKMLTQLLQKNARYETKRDALGAIVEIFDIIGAYDNEQEKEVSVQALGDFERAIGDWSIDNIGDKKLATYLENVLFELKKFLLSKVVSRQISDEEMKGILKRIPDEKLYHVVGLYYRINEGEIKEKAKIVLNKLLELSGDANKLNHWLYEESEWNKEETKELIKAGYDASLWNQGVIIEEEVSSREAGEALKELNKQTEQLIEIAEKLGIPVSEEIKKNGLNTYQEAKQFTDEVIISAAVKKETEAELSIILDETERLEKIYQDTKIRKEVVRVEIKKDFLEDAYSGVGVPGCFNPLTGIHKEAPLVHALEANGFFLRVYRQEKMIANAVIVLTDKGAVAFGLYNSTNLNLDEPVFEAIKELSRKVPRVLMIEKSASFDKAKLYGREEAILANKHERILREAYHDFGINADGNTAFDMKLSLTQDMIQQKGGFKEKPKRSIEVKEVGPKQADFDWDGLAKSMISQGLKDYLFLIGELKKDKIDMNAVTREIILGKIIQKGHQINDNDLGKIYEIIQSLSSETAVVSLGAQVSHIKKLDNLLRILNVLRKSENVLEIAEDASDRDIIKFCIKYLEARGLIATTTDEDGNVVITINNNALNHPDETVRRFVEVIQRWVINPEGGVKAVNFQGEDGVWMIVGFESELQNKDTLEHEQKEIKFRKQGLSWIEAHNQAVAETGKGQKIDKEDAAKSGSGRQDEIGAEVGLPKEQAIKQINELKKAIQMGKYQHEAVVDLRSLSSEKEVILVGDLHTRLDNLKKVLNQNGNLEKIRKGEAVLVILGDAVHGEIDYREMDSSIRIMQFIMGLKIDNPGNVYYLLGNHDYLSGNFTKNNVPQGILYRNRMEELYGKEYVALYEDFIKASPLIVVGNGFIGVHGGPIKGATLEEIQKVNIADEKNLIVNHAEWGRYKDKEVGYDEKDVQEFLENMGQADGFLIVGHSPHHIPSGKFFARLCENHYVIFAGREQAGYAVMQAGKIGFVEVAGASPILEEAIKAESGGKQNSALSEKGNKKGMENQWVPSNEPYPVPYETDLEKWQKSRSLDLESLPEGALVYLGDTGTWVNYLIKIEKDGKLKLWINGNSGCYIGTAALLQPINGAKGKIDADKGIGFPYFKWGEEGLLNLDNRTAGERWWVQSFPVFRILYTKDHSRDKVGRIDSNEGELNTKVIGGQRSGGISETFFVDNAWIAAGKFIYKIWVEADKVFFRRYEKDKITPIGGIHIVSLDQQIQVGREIGYYILPSDMTLSSKHFLFRVSRAENGKFMLRVEDLKSLNGTVVEWNEPQDFELDDPGKGPGAASRLELPNNKVKEAKELLRKGKMLDARRLLEEAIEDYQRIIMGYGGTEGQTANPFLQAAKKNIMIAQILLDKIPGKKGPLLSIHKKENGLQGSNIDALINYRIQKWSKWLQDSRDRLKILNPEQIPAVIIENEEKLARERENILNRTLELKNIMKSDNIREFVRALKEVNDGAEKELSLRQEIVLATIAKELKGHPYIDFNPEEILFIPASSWLHDFFEFRGVCGRIMAVNDGTDSGNIILIDESRNKTNLELLNTLIHEIIHKQFRNGGYIVQQARPQERQLFRILEEALTERLARKLTQDIYLRNPQINVKSPEEKLFEIIYGEETAYLSKSYPMEGRLLEEVLKALGGNAEEAIFKCLKTGDLTLLRDLLGSRWEKIVAIVEGTNAKSDFYNLGLYIITRSVNDKQREQGLDASIKALNIMKRIDIWDVLGEKAVELFNLNPSGEFMGAIVSRAGVKLLDEILGASAADFDSKDIKGKFIEYVRAETMKFIRLKVDFDKAGSRKLPSARTFANYQIGKLAKAEITPDLKLKVTDSKGNVSVLDLALQGEMDINSLKSQIESMQDIENDHRQVILSILSLLEKSPPKLYKFSGLIEDLFGVASSERKLIALHQDLSGNPIALFHEIAEYLISSDVLDIRLKEDVLVATIKDKHICIMLEGETLAIAQKNPDNPHYLLRALQREVFKYEDRTLTRQIKEGQTEISKQLATSSLINIYQAMVDMYESEQVLETMLPKMNLLEIGPGQEVKLIGFLKSRGANIVGVELPYPNLSAENISPGLVKQIEGGAAEYLKGVKPGTLDIIYSNHVLEEGNPSITRGEIREILISSKEALKDNGYIIIQVFDEFGAPSEEELRTLGFIIKRSESLDEGRHYLWVLQKAPQIDSKPEARNPGEVKESETPPDSEVDNKELRQIIAKFEGQIEVSPDDVAQYVPGEIKILFEVAKKLGLTIILTGGTARDFAMAAHLKRKLPMPVLSDIDIAIIPEDGSAVLGYGDWAKEKYELLNEELRKRGYTYKVDFSAGVRTQDTYVFENFMNTKSSSAFGLSRLAVACTGNKYIIFGKSEAINDLNNKVLSVDIEKVDAPGEGMSTKMIGKAAIYRDFAGIEMDSYLKESILKDVNLIKGKGKDAITKFVKDIFDYMKVNDKNDDPIERLRKTIRELNLSEALGFSEEELIKLAQGSPGGIDFRTMPIITQPMQSSSVGVSLGAEVSSLAKAVPVANLDNEWQEIQNMLNAGMIPSGERIKEYLQDSSRKQDLSHDIDKIISCIADILRMEEERVFQTEPALKELLVLLESDKPASEIQLSLAKITILPAILKPVNP